MFRPSSSRRLRSARRAADQAQGAARQAHRSQAGRSATAAISTRTADLVLRHACRLSLEGVVSKLRDAPYRSGRGKSWVKSEMLGTAGICRCRLCAVDHLAKGDRLAGARRLRRATSFIMSGRVGTGFTAAPSAETLFQRLERIRTPSSPFDKRLSAEEARQVRYVRPETGCRGRVPCLDCRRHSAPRFLPWVARRQASTRNRARDRSQDAAGKTKQNGGR